MRAKAFGISLGICAVVSLGLGYLQRADHRLDVPPQALVKTEKTPSTMRTHIDVDSKVSSPPTWTQTTIEGNLGGATQDTTVPDVLAPQPASLATEARFQTPHEKAPAQSEPASLEAVVPVESAMSFVRPPVATPDIRVQAIRAKLDPQKNSSRVLIRVLEPQAPTAVAAKVPDEPVVVLGQRYRKRRNIDQIEASARGNQVIISLPPSS